MEIMAAVPYLEATAAQTGHAIHVAEQEIANTVMESA